MARVGFLTRRVEDVLARRAGKLVFHRQPQQAIRE